MILAAVLVVQIALAFSTQYTILPAVEAITQKSWRGELGPFLLFYIQLLLCIPTFVLLILAISTLSLRAYRNRQPTPSVIPRDRNR